MLPKKVDLNILECEMIEKSDNLMKEECKFKLVLEAKICNIEEANSFIKDLERKTQCKYNKRGRKYKGNKGWISD